MLDSPFRVRTPAPLSALRACDSSSCETVRLSELSFSAWSRGELIEAMRLAVSASQMHSECAGNCLGLASVWYSTLLLRIRELGSGARVLAGIDESTQGAEGIGELAAASLVCAADIALTQGDLDTAVDLAAKGVHKAQQADLNCLLPAAHTVLALSALRQGNMSVILDHADQLRNDALLGQTIYRPGQSAWATAQLLEVQGGVKSAAHLIVGIITDEKLVSELLASQPAAASWLVRSTRRLGDEALAEQVVSKAAALAAHNSGLRSIEAAAIHAGGLMEENPERLISAAELHLDPWASASAYEDAGTLLSAIRPERDRAVEILERAVDGYSKSGAPRDARRVVSRLRSLGVRRGRYPQYASHDRANVDFLTNTEAAVAELVSQGFTNSQVGERLFISGHTVAFHLKKIFRKVNVASRVELTRTWSRISSGDH